MVDQALMPRLVPLERRELRRAGLALMAGLPLVVRHAINVLAALLLGQRDSALVRRILEPVRKAVAAEAGQVHEIDVLNVGAVPQMLDESAESGGFQLGPGHGVQVHHGPLRPSRATKSLS